MTSTESQFDSSFPILLTRTISFWAGHGEAQYQTQKIEETQIPEEVSLL